VVFHPFRVCLVLDGEEIKTITAKDIVPNRHLVIFHLPQEPVPDDVPKDWRWWYVFGLYISEGTAYLKFNRSRDGEYRKEYIVYFTLGKHERELINRLVSTLRRLGFNPLVYNHTKSTVRVVVYSKKLYETVMSLFGKYAKHKKIPFWVLSLPRESKEAFLRGIRDGDGDKDNYVTTVNFNIALMTWLTALSIRRPATITCTERRNEIIIDGRRVNHEPYYYRVRIVKGKNIRQSGRYWFGKGFVALEVIEKTEITEFSKGEKSL